DVRAQVPSRLFDTDRVARRVTEISEKLPGLRPALAASLPGLVRDLLLAGTAMVGGRPLLPYALLMRLLDGLAADPVIALRNLGYRNRASEGVPDESFAQRWARFGVQHLPVDMVGPALASPLFDEWLQSPWLGVMLAEAARFGSVDRVTADSPVAM